jgi:phosphatidylserine decarboxylase
MDNGPSPGMGLTMLQPKWYALRSNRKGKKKSDVSGDILLQFSLVDSTNRDASSQQIYQKFKAIAGAADAELEGMDELQLARTDSGDLSGFDDEGETDAAPEEGDENTPPDVAAKKRRKLRLARIRRRATLRAYEFSNGSDIAGILYIEVVKIIDLPPEKNCMCNTTFCSSPLTNSSRTNRMGHGPIRGHLAREKDISDASSATRPQPRLQREAGFPSCES